jgi:excisionase family DNA binding protein
MGEGSTQDAQHNAQPDTQYVSVGEAAQLLNVHRNTVHNRIKAGRIRAHKVIEGDREVYRVERDSLGIGRTDAHVHTLDAQRPMPGEEIALLLADRLEDIVQGYALELGDVREQLGEERAKRQQAEERVSATEEEAQRLREELEAERSKGFWRRLFGG